MFCYDFQFAIENCAKAGFIRFYCPAYVPE